MPSTKLPPIPPDLERTRWTFRGGVHPPERKTFSEERAIERPALPPEVRLPLVMHAGAPAKPVVEKKAEVARGQLVAEPAGFISAPIHAPVSGTVKDITPVWHPSGRMVPAIILATDAEATAAAIEEEAARTVAADHDISALAPEAIVEAVKTAGIVGLGGAAFPSFVKLMRLPEKPIDFVLLNGSECEPYLTADHRMMLERPAPILAGLRLAMRATGAERAAIAIEDNKPDAIETLRAAVREANVSERIEVAAVKSKYPQGGERTLIPAVTRRAVPVGGFPPDIGVCILNVGTAAAIAQAVVCGAPLIERVVSLTGRGVREPGNLLVPIGTPVSYLVEQRGGLTADAARVILGGPMMGPTAAHLEIPILKGMSGITVMVADEVRPRPEMPCIRCGRCVDACPVDLMPALIGRYVAKRMIDEALATHLMACVECGTCSYVCPSSIPLVQYMRSGKFLARKLQQQQKQ